VTAPPTQTAPDDRRPTIKLKVGTQQSERRFGIRPPKNGETAPFRVLVSTRWLWASLIAGLLTLAIVRQASRRGRLLLLLSGIASGLLAALTAISQTRRLTFEHIELPITGLPAAFDGFRIVHLSDIHTGRSFAVKHLRHALAWTHQQNPDLLVFTGDFAHYPRGIPILHRELQGIAAPYGVYAVLGNHDYWVGDRTLERVLTNCGIDVLRNERRCVRKRDAELWVAGIDSVWEMRHDLSATLGGLPQDATVLVLAHEPDIADEVAAHGAAVQLSGHTHAGHIAFPGLGPLFLPRHGFQYFRGLHRIQSTWLYVSRGLSGIPIRFGSPPEVTCIVLRAA
jgi:predicted MPP superfamily phosphohydrolase